MNQKRKNNWLLIVVLFLAIAFGVFVWFTYEIYQKAKAVLSRASKPITGNVDLSGLKGAKGEDGRGFSFINFRFVEESITGNPNKLLIQTRKEGGWEDVQIWESPLINP